MCITIDNPLVSIVVITYNSSNTIIETLESAKQQSYQKIELIVSDDGSTDNTVDLVEKWLKENAYRFVNYKVLNSTFNTGVSANLNRGIKEANGKWIKPIAGDDLLLPHSIQKYVSEALNVGFKICLARVEMFPERTPKEFEWRYKGFEYMYAPIMTYDRIVQYRTSLYEHILPGPALFYQKTVWESIGGYDEKYTRSEEMSFQIRVFEKYPVYFVDDFLVRWRQRLDSLSHGSSYDTILQDMDFYKNVQRKKMEEERMFFRMIDKDIHRQMVLALVQRKAVSFLFFKVLSRFSPFKYIKYLKIKFANPVYPKLQKK